MVFWDSLAWSRCSGAGKAWLFELAKQFLLSDPVSVSVKSTKQTPFIVLHLLYFGFVAFLRQSVGRCDCGGSSCVLVMAGNSSFEQFTTLCTQQVDKLVRCAQLLGVGKLQFPITNGVTVIFCDNFSQNRTKLILKYLPIVLAFSLSLS